MSGVTPAGRRRWVRIALLAVIAAGFGLRLWIATAHLDNTRHFDERFSLANVAALIDDGTLRPANAYYPSLSWLPQALVMGASEALARVTGVEAFSVHSEATSDGWSPTAYLLARLVSVVWGTLGIVAVYLLGRRLFDPRAGLAAAALVAALPPHVVASGLFKPDILVALLVTLTVLWSVDAAERPSFRRFALAGAGVGLAVAAKYTGVGAAFAVAVAALWGGWRSGLRGWGRRWLMLAAAGAVSLALFFLINPHSAVIFSYLPRLWGIMESKGEASGVSHLGVLGQAAWYPVRHHGWAVALLALAGVIGLLARLVRRGTEPGRRREAAIVLAYALGYPLLYAASTRLFKGQNLLPVACFTALAAGWAAVGLWDRAAARLPARWLPASRRPWLAGLIAVSLAVAACLPAMQTVYATVVPTTWEVAQGYLGGRLEPAAVRRIYYERGPGLLDRLEPASGGHRLPAIGVERLAEVPPADLDRADGEAFFAARLGEPGSAFYLRRAALRGGAAERFEPAWLRARGPALVVVLHGWELAGPPETAAVEPLGGNRFRVTLGTPAAAGEPVTLALRVPRTRRGARPREVSIDGEAKPLLITRAGGGLGHYQTAKLDLPAGAAEFELGLDPAIDLAAGFEVEIWRWRPGAP